MPHGKKKIATILEGLDLGSSVAEKDTVLSTSRVETSVFVDLLHDKVDLIPGTKGSGKSALYRIFAEFLPEQMLQSRRVVIAHGVRQQGDSVFHAYKAYFGVLSEQDFVTFWCVYIISLANEQFIKNQAYHAVLKGCDKEIAAFRTACRSAKLPDFDKPKSLFETLGWALQAIKTWRPKIKYSLPADGGEIELNLFGDVAIKERHKSAQDLPAYAQVIKDSLEAILRKQDLSLWLMVDKLDEIFPRRSEMEKRALRGLLKTLQIFESNLLRVKIFLRDDILEEVADTDQGFTALTHITVRKADTLRWDEDNILAMIVKRIASHEPMRRYLEVDLKRLDGGREYKRKVFDMVFPPTVSGGSRRYTTIRWLYNRTMDGKGVVTPRDFIDLLTKAVKHQYDDCCSDPSGSIESIVEASSLRYGLRELSDRKRDTYLKAEFPHLWKYIEKLVSGRTEISEAFARSTFGSDWAAVSDHLIAIGVLKAERKADGSRTYKVPMVYRHGLRLIQGRTA